MVGEEEMTKVPIHLNPAHPADSLPESSRINYSKLYRVDHNLRVKDVGLVDVDCVHTLVRYFEESSIKLTEDLKFREDFNGPRVENTETAQIRDLPADSSDSNIPQIFVNDHNQHRDTQYFPGAAGDIADAPQDEPTESLFEFEL
jgi:hypothetical protein